ncbi:MAG: YicC/YloC family endoribonuclease [Kofleriaceae bacterium]
MTGFGRGVAERSGVRATVDLRTVNHRFLDLKLRATVAPSLEEQIATRIRASIERGAVAVSVHVVRPTTTSTLHIDEAIAHEVHESLRRLASKLGLPSPDLALVLAQPGVVQTSVEDPDSESNELAILAALDHALTELTAMRATEGAALARELLARIDELAQLRAQIEQHAAGVTAKLHEKLLDRLHKLLGDAAIDQARLAQEVALLAERADITEEIVRLGSHLEQARAIIGGTAAAGRKLDFLVQEIGRELNTIGSKSQRTEISTAIVEAKSVLEKLREQVQNVE